tara:strand:- start:267 stop:563 length:297 start_codon:yes stop_codon:yes gene_type:complete
MIDADKYEGHKPGPWKITCFERTWYVNDENEDTVCELWGKAQRKDPTARLLADAPLLLEEVKRLRVRYSHHHQYVTNFYAWMVENHIGLVEKWEDEEE